MVTLTAVTEQSTWFMAMFSACMNCLLQRTPINYNSEAEPLQHQDYTII